jgi:peptide chain release factor
MLFDAQRREGAAAGRRGLWDQNQALERGNAVRSYRGEKFAPS